MKLRVSRRGLLAGAGAGVLATAAEYVSFRGAFDHRRPARTATPSERDAWHASLRLTDGGARGIVHLAHSTHLVAFGAFRVLTDPWFYDPAFGALSHDTRPPVPPGEVGRLDAILITHDHADHADLRALDEMDKRAVVFAATSDLASRVRRLGYLDVCVLEAWKERRLGPVTITAVPALHDVYEVGYVAAEEGRSVYFAGDTRLHPDLPAIAERFSPSLAILPVDGTRLVGGALHVMTPEDAVAASRTLASKIVMPSHAEAYFSDPVAGTVLASTVKNASLRFAEIVRRDLPGVRCDVPRAGELVPF